LNRLRAISGLASDFPIGSPFEEVAHHLPDHAAVVNNQNGIWHDVKYHQRVAGILGNDLRRQDSDRIYNARICLSIQQKV
jgi:hypothetical protein